MSFILDALKKSEKERQRSAVPGIGDLPIVVQRERPAAWTLALIAGLGVAVVGLAVAWWRSTGVETVAAGGPPATLPTRTVQEPAPLASITPPMPAETRSLASEATRMVDIERATPSPGADPSGASQALAQPVAVRPGVVTDGPMSIAAARLAGMPVPELTLELLVYSSDPAKRFVYINSAKYAEGDTLADGPELVEITTTGAVLSYGGRTYVLPQN